MPATGQAFLGSIKSSLYHATKLNSTGQELLVTEKKGMACHGQE
jgi:hypothetical protein